MTARLLVVGSDGRSKAYRPLAEAERAKALAAGLAAYERSDFFAAHEYLEPAWMGTLDVVERAWLQGLIKLAAAYVHEARGNPAGTAKNLHGARMRLAEAAQSRRLVPTKDGARLDLTEIIAAIDRRLADLTAHPAKATLGPPVLRRSAR